MKKFKKIFLVLLLLIGTLVTFTGCNDNNVDPATGGSEVEVDVGDEWFP